MSTNGVVRGLAEVFLWVGITGSGIAVLCAIVAAVALAVGAAGLAGGSAAVWIGGAMLSLTSGFSGQWLPALIAGGALVVGLTVGALVRPMVQGLRRPSAADALDAAIPARPSVPAASNVKVGAAATTGDVSLSRIVGVHKVASESIR